MTAVILVTLNLNITANGTSATEVFLAHTGAIQIRLLLLLLLVTSYRQVSIRRVKTVTVTTPASAAVQLPLVLSDAFSPPQC